MSALQGRYALARWLGPERVRGLRVTERSFPQTDPFEKPGMRGLPGGALQAGQKQTPHYLLLQSGARTRGRRDAAGLAVPSGAGGWI